MRSVVNSLRLLIERAALTIKKKEFYLNLLLIYFPFLFVTCVFLHMGINMQYYSMRIIGGGAQNIYASSFDNGIAIFPSIGEWLETIADPILIAQSIFVTVFTFSQSSKRNSLIAAFLSSLAVVTFTDIVSLIYSNNLNSNDVAVDLLCNTVGFFAYSLVICLLISLHEGISQNYLKNSLRSWFVLAGVVTICSSLALSGATFFVLLFLYQPTQVVVDMVAELPATGYLASETDKAKLGTQGQFEGDAVSGRLLPSDGVRADFRQSSPKQRARYVWENSRAGIYNVSISFYADCWVPGKLSDLPKEIYTIKFPVKKKIIVQFNEGWTEFSAEIKSDARYQITNDGPNAFWVKNEKDGKYDITSFTSNDSVVSANISKGFIFYILAPFMDIAKSGPYLKNRSISISIDDKKYNFEFDRAPVVLEKTKLSCRSVGTSPGPVGPAGRKYVLSAGVKIQIDPQVDDVFKAGFQESNLKIDNANGWTYFKNIEKDKLNNEWLGRFYNILLFGKQISLTVDGVRKEALQGNIQARGQFDAQYTETGMRFLGKADALWQGNDRMNPTRWERLSIEMQITILTALSALALMLIRLALPIWRRTFTGAAIFRLS